MATLLKPDAVFLHVPKTGGTFLRKLFVDMGLVRFNFGRDHADMERTINVSGHYPGNYLLRSLQLGGSLDRYVDKCYKFCFVRNPFDWYESYWRFLNDRPGLSFKPQKNRSRFGFPIDPWHPGAALEPLVDPDFNRFIDKVVRHCPGYLTQMFGWYADPQHIDFVGKQETLENDMRHIFEQLKIKYDPGVFAALGRVNESRAPRPLWSAQNREMIGKLEFAVFQQYGYTM